MKDDYYYCSEPDQDGRKSLTCIDGMRITQCENRFELLVQPHCEIRENQTVQMFRDWLRKRQEKLRESGDLSE